MSDELGRDAGSVSVLLRKHANFEHDLQTLASRVQEIQDDSSKLQASYAGDKAREITSREADVVNAWLNLQAMCDARKSKLSDTGDLFKFFNMVRTLMLWMDDLTRQMNSSEKPRYLTLLVLTFLCPQISHQLFSLINQSCLNISSLILTKCILRFVSFLHV